jgi:WD40 repeat protein
VLCVCKNIYCIELIDIIMKVETPQILWNSEDASKGLPAALMGVTLIESGLTVSSGGGVHGNTTTPTYCLATAGNCNSIHLWKVEFAAETNNNSSSSSIFQKDAAASTKIDFLCALTRHEGPVNAVKFSPDGLHLATASDTGSIIVWSVPVNKRANANGKHYWSTVSKENTDLQVKIVARAMDGVTDISWSNDSKRFVCGTIDHCVMVFEDANYSSNSTSAAATVAAAAEWKIAYRSASNHSHYVQGVAYDPSNVYLASQSSDRTVRVLSRKVQSKKKVLRPSNNCSTSTTCTAIPPAEHAVAVQQLLTDSKLDFSMKTKQLKYRKNNKDTEDSATTTADGDGESAPATATTVNSSSAKQYLYAAETTLESFVRRLAWTVDGAYLITPAAVWNMTASVVSASNDEKQKAGRYATLVYQRHRFEEPWKVLGGLEKVNKFGCKEKFNAGISLSFCINLVLVR